MSALTRSDYVNMTRGERDGSAAQTPSGTSGGEPPAASGLLTVTEVAAMLRVSKMTIYRMVHSGQLPHIRVGRSFRIPAEPLRALLDDDER